MAKPRGRPSRVESQEMREAAVAMEATRTPGSVIASRLGITRQTLSAWRKEPEYRAAVQMPLEERRQLAQEAATLVLGSLWTTYVAHVLGRLDSQATWDLEDLRKELEFAAKWAGIRPPEPQAGARDLETLLRQAAERCKEE